MDNVLLIVLLIVLFALCLVYFGFYLSGHRFRRLKDRGAQLKLLAEEFGLQFTSNMPTPASLNFSMSGFWVGAPFKFFRLEGTLNSHQVLVSDRRIGYVLTNGPHTVFKVDGKYEDKLFGLVTFFFPMFASVKRIRRHLEAINGRESP